MDTFGYGRCSQCDEENFLVDGSKCAQCLRLTYGLIDDQDDEDNEEQPSSISLDRLRQHPTP